MPHGAAVARGLVVESRLAGDVTGFPEAHQERLMRLLERWKLPTRVPARFETRAIVRAAHSDKKARAGRIRCALPLALGKGPRGRDVTFEVSDARLVRALDALR